MGVVTYEILIADSDGPAHQKDHSAFQGLPTVPILILNIYPCLIQIYFNPILFFRPAAKIPVIPVPNKTSVAGSGTGAEEDGPLLSIDK